MPKVINIS